MSEEMQLALEHTLKTMRKLKEAKAEIERLRAAMSDAEKAYQATPASTLEEEIMNPCIAKNEREWWAAAEIERLRSDLEAADIAVSRLNGSSELQMLMRENNKLRACLVDIATGQVIELPFIQALARAALEQEKPNE